MNGLKPGYKIAVCSLLLAACVFATFYAHFVLETEAVFTHFFYVPIILACLWWPRKGIWVALFLAMILIVSHLASPIDTPIWQDLERSFFFVFIGAAVGILAGDRDRALEDLHNSEERLRSLVDTTSDWVWEVDRDASYTYSNPKVKDLLGYEPEEVIGKTPFDLMPPDEAERVAVLFRDVLASVKSFSGLENINLHRDGRHVVLETSGVPILDTAGNLLGYRGIDRDITERKRAKEELEKHRKHLEELVEERTLEIMETNEKLQKEIAERREAERLIRVQRDLALRMSGMRGFTETLETAIEAILEATGLDCGGVYLVDEETGCLDLAYHRGLSDVFIEATGHYDARSPSTELVISGLPVYREYKELDLPKDDARLREGLRVIAIIPIVHEEKVIGCVNAASHTLVDIPQKSRDLIEIMVGQIGDFIARFRLTSDLRESEERYRLFYDHAGEMIFSYDRDMSLIGINRMACDFIGYSEEEMLGRNVLDLGIIHPEDLQKAARGIERLFSGEKAFNEELRLVRKDGSVVFVLMTGAAMRGSDGEVVAITDIVRDISERKRMEEEIRARNLELDAFSSTVSHDLRGSLYLIDGFSQIAMSAADEGREDMERECMEKVHQATRRMDRHIESLLRYAQAGRPGGEIIRVEPGNVLREILADLEDNIHDRGIEISAKEDFPAIRVDPVKLHQVLSNLVSNAVKYLGDDNPHPRVEIGSEWGGGLVTIYVRDNGIGIGPREREKIFEPFERFSTRTYPGMGIGLSTVKRAVEGWGGRVWVDSTPDEGSTFFFTATAADR